VRAAGAMEAVPQLARPNVEVATPRRKTTGGADAASAGAVGAGTPLLTRRNSQRSCRALGVDAPLEITLLLELTTNLSE